MPGRKFAAFIAGFLLTLALLPACDTLFGSKSDPITDEIFEEGRIDPRLLEDVGYVPLTPFYTQGLMGPLRAPKDVYIGYDEFIYVIDEDGLHVIDLAGRPVEFIAFDQASAVVQDRRLHVYVIARRDTSVGGFDWNLPAIHRFSGISTGVPILEDIIWHPFDDDSRKFSRPDPLGTDRDVQFTGVGVLHDNRILVSRKGPVNNIGTPILPHNAVMEFTPDGINTQTITALNPVTPSLRSAINPSDILTFFHPPQRVSYRLNDNFILGQQTDDDSRLQYSVVAIRPFVTPDGIVYRSDPAYLQAVGNPDRGDGFLFEEYKFDQPSDFAFAADGSNYIFVLDEGSDSLFVFTSSGIEGVAPPPGATSTKPVVVSFGGTGTGPLQFDKPQGVSYFRQIVYVADTGNNRICRYKLNTDFE
jgi:hypothetical protein